MEGRWGASVMPHSIAKDDVVRVRLVSDRQWRSAGAVASGQDKFEKPVWKGRGDQAGQRELDLHRLLRLPGGHRVSRSPINVLIGIYESGSRIVGVGGPTRTRTLNVSTELKNPTFHPTDQSDTTGRIRHHRTDFL